MDDLPDFLIVGAGTFGVSTAYHLAQHLDRPSQVVLLDRAAPPSAPAASTDINKIIQADYTNPLYVSLGFEAIDAWKSLPFFRDAGVYHPSGWISMDEKHSDAPALIKKHIRDCGRGDVLVDMTEEEVRQAWGGLLQRTDCSPFGSYYYNSSAGWADAGKASQLMAQEAIRPGVQYKVGEARRIVCGEQGILGVKTADGTIYHARKVLLATGAWTSQLMSSVEDDLDLPEADRVERQVLAAGVIVSHFQLSPEEKARYSQLPVLVYGGQGEVIPPTAEGILKFTNATSFTNTIRTVTGHKISVPLPDQAGVPQQLQEDHIRAIRPRLPQILDNNHQPDYWRLCWDAISPTQHPLITRHPDDRLSHLYFAVGGSFHCYKFLPTIGKYVVNVLHGVSNGPEKDKAWAWKTVRAGERGVHEHLVPEREFRDFA
ncbi:FAD/NAD(P)-binding domain-containing protein [Aspergillus sclerotiicarbonarius CBS 121057]|uniref:FAD/NAD(P)-binding domain-containing protein n=1 Tax=Aspergillus sclerotiicarbonarius (strain CBS 121057 / IBT 28362) TaxID=1448318 RepID=A0A319ESA8_ASPSB|nr:FAD/NAD(P)-binding domain-containing protein [Aspergillus sclerotiicarbonarius CBS 121057]